MAKKFESTMTKLLWSGAGEVSRLDEFCLPPNMKAIWFFENPCLNMSFLAKCLLYFLLESCSLWHRMKRINFSCNGMVDILKLGVPRLLSVLEKPPDYFMTSIFFSFFQLSWCRVVDQPLHHPFQFY